MIRGAAGQTIGAEMIDALSGAAFAGVVTVYITGDAGVQALGTVGSGICTAEGNGFYTYRPSLAETDYAVVAFTFIGTGAVPATIQIPTLTATQTAALQVASVPGVMTVQDLLTRVLIDLKVYQSGEVLTADDADLALRTLNDWIDDLGSDSGGIFTVTRQTWTLTSAASYTVGLGATVNITRPVNPQVIANIGYQDTSVTPVQERLFGGVLTQDQYDAIPQKTLTGVYPAMWFYNPTFGTTGFGTLSPWPVPTSSTLQGVIYAPTPVAEFTAISQAISVPPGYRRFFRTNLAKELAGAFDAPVTPELREAAATSAANVKRANERLMDLSTGVAGSLFGGGGWYDIASDTYR